VVLDSAVGGQHGWPPDEPASHAAATADESGRHTAGGGLSLAAVGATARGIIDNIDRVIEGKPEAARLAGATGSETMSRYRIGAVGGPILGGMVHRLSTAQPDAQMV